MKKALAFISALALGSAAQSDGFLSDNELRLRPVSYNPTEDFTPEDFPRKFPRDLPRVVYADDEQYVSADDDEQYTGFNLVQNWHYPLKPIARPIPYVPFKPAPAQNQPQIEEDSADNALFDLGQAIQKSMAVYQKGVEVVHRKNEVRKIKSPHNAPSSKKDADEENPVLPCYQRQRR